jgi:hypothetical protein
MLQLTYLQSRCQRDNYVLMLEESQLPFVLLAGQLCL